MLIQSLIYFVICDETTTVVTTVDTTTGEVITTTTEEETTTTTEMTTTTENPANFPKDGKADDETISRSGLSHLLSLCNHQGLWSSWWRTSSTAVTCYTGQPSTTISASQTSGASNTSGLLAIASS